jgi:ISXO2-like transposase domain
MPRVHRVASLLKRWLLGTHQGGISVRQADFYLDEFVFRFNRRSRGTSECSSIGSSSRQHKQKTLAMRASSEAGHDPERPSRITSRAAFHGGNDPTSP